MGVSEHTDDNRKVYRFRLDGDDRAKIEAVLARSNGARLIQSIGDCGAEYRQNPPGTPLSLLAQSDVCE